MAAATAWSKLGSWALDSEAADQDGNGGNQFGSSISDPNPAAAADFPSLADAKTKQPRKKKNQALSLAEFTTGQSVTHGAAKYAPSRGLTVDETLSLPTGPRERSAEELERSGRGFGYSYGLGRGGGSARDEPRRAREPAPDLGTSRADEADDWGAAKRSNPAPFPERRERGGGMFFDTASRADESDTWMKKTAPPPLSEGRRMGGGFDAPRRGGGFDSLNRDGMDSESWLKKREDTTSLTPPLAAAGGGSRPRLVLQPRTRPLANDDGTSNGHGQHTMEEPEPQPQPPVPVPQKSKSNPFGAARPREEVLAEKGQDWKKIDEKLDSMKVSEVPSEVGRRGFSSRNLGTEDRTERTWRKPDSPDNSVSSSAAEFSEGGLADN